MAIAAFILLTYVMIITPGNRDLTLPADAGVLETVNVFCICICICSFMCLHVSKDRQSPPNSDI